MAQKVKRTEMMLPPQLIGVLEDALRIQATAFKIEHLPPVVMASFSTPSQAMEIDFEPEAGQEMIDYIVGQSSLRNGKGRFVLEYEGKRFECTVTAERNRVPGWVRVSWALDSERTAEPAGAGDASSAPDLPRWGKDRK